MPWGVVAASVIGAVGSGIESGNAAGDVAGADQQALKDLQAYFQLGYNGLQPFQAGGTNALSALQRSLGLTPGGSTYQQSPGYQFELGQGLNAITNKSAATGGIHSGNTLKALQSFGTGLANQDYQQYLGNLMGVSGQGLTAAGDIAQLSSNMGQNVAGLTVGQGAANASGAIGQGNAFNSLAGALGGNYGGGSNGFQSIWQNLFNTGGGGGVPTSGSGLWSQGVF